MTLQELRKLESGMEVYGGKRLLCDKHLIPVAIGWDSWGYGCFRCRQELLARAMVKVMEKIELGEMPGDYAKDSQGKVFKGLRSMGLSPWKKNKSTKGAKNGFTKNNGNG